jgi:hypothetical protein
MGEREPTPISPAEFTRRMPEDSPAHGPGAGPDAPETVEPTQGERLPPAERRPEDAPGPESP